MTTLEIMNAVQRNNGLTAVSSLTSLTGLDLKIFNFINDAIFELGVKENWIPLENLQTITLVTSTSTYTKTSTINKYDKFSFRYNETKKLTFRSAQEIDDLYPCQTNLGLADDIYEYGGYFTLPKIPSSDYNTKTIKYRAWNIPALLSTSTATGTCWFPEGYDRTVLVNYATYKVMEFRYIEEYKEYKKKVLGDREFGEEGFLDIMRRDWRSPNPTQIRVTTVF